MMWALVLILHVAAVGTREEIVNDHLRDWVTCMQSAVPALHGRRDVIGVRCEPSRGRGV